MLQADHSQWREVAETILVVSDAVRKANMDLAAAAEAGVALHLHIVA